MVKQILLLFCLLLPGCLSNTFVGPNLDYVCTQVYWLTPAQVTKRCGAGKDACASVGNRGGTAAIWAVQPENFDDRKRIQALGHEFFHNLGADHKEE